MHEAAVSFAIKEESPDEMLWVSEPVGPMGEWPLGCCARRKAARLNVASLAGSAAHYRRPAAESHRTARSEAKSVRASEFGDPCGQREGDGGLQLTVKTEKEEDRPSGFGPDGCRHGAAGKRAQLAADFSMDERENQLWSTIIEGNDIDAGFPDFSSVVEEYSNTFPDHSDAAAAAQPCNGVDVGGGVPQASGGFKPRPPDRPKEELRSQRSASRPPAAAGEHSHAGCFHAHKPASGAAAVAPRGYACSHCGKTFGRHHQFKLHQQSHKRKRAFWCAVCGKSFQCSSHLGIHHRTHTGEKPYGCSLCGKRFTQQSSLRVHQRTHSGERPYSCSLCGKTFILMHHLKRHTIIHTYS